MQRQFSGKRIFFYAAGTTGYLYGKKKKINLYLYPTPYTKISSKGITDMNIKPKTIKPLEENIREILCDPRLSKYSFFVF